jgi:hypothetical protein
MNVDVEIDLADAGLRRAMRAAFVRAAFAPAGVADIRKLQAAPLRQRGPEFSPANCQASTTSSPAPVGADDVRTEFAAAPVINADHLLRPEDGVANRV